MRQARITTTLYAEIRKGKERFIVIASPDCIANAAKVVVGWAVRSDIAFNIRDADDIMRALKRQAANGWNQ